MGPKTGPEMAPQGDHIYPGSIKKAKGNKAFLRDDRPEKGAQVEPENGSPISQGIDPERGLKSTQVKSTLPKVDFTLLNSTSGAPEVDFKINPAEINIWQMLISMS